MVAQACEETCAGERDGSWNYCRGGEFLLLATGSSGTSESRREAAELTIRALSGEASRMFGESGRHPSRAQVNVLFRLLNIHSFVVLDHS
jgi:hypothetical protein